MNSKPFERDTNFETEEEDVRGPFILEEVGTTVAVKRSKISLSNRAYQDRGDVWLTLFDERISLFCREEK